jgi:hypothetical protein
VSYQPEARSTRDSNAIVRNADLELVPACILAIVDRKSQPGKPLILVQRLVEVDPDLDPYAKFGFTVAGGLFLDRYHSPEVVECEALVTLFARTAFEYSTLGEVVHVLPIMKVSAFIYVLSMRLTCGFCRICILLPRTVWTMKSREY